MLAGPELEEQEEDLRAYGALSPSVQERLLASTESLKPYGALAPLQDRRNAISVQPFNLVRFSPGIQSQPSPLLNSLKPYGALAGPKPPNF